MNTKRLMIALLLCSVTLQTLAATLTGRVVAVSDGDTLTVLTPEKQAIKIRLAGIDAPEKNQAFGQKSKEHLSGLVFNQTVQVDYSKTDKYGRTVGKVLVSGQDANLAQIQAGYAWHYKEYQKEQSPVDRQRYAAAENAARSNQAGLWQDKSPTAPWDFRHGVKPSATASPPAPNTAPVTNSPSATNTVISTNSHCPCGSGQTCTGKRGGHYCLTPSGKKHYQH